MAQEPTRTRPFVADPNEWEVVEDGGDDYEVVEETPAATWSDRLGLNQPTDSMMSGFMRGAGAGAVDLVQGAVSNVTGRMNEKVRGENATRAELGTALGHAPSSPKPEVMPAVESPGNFSGMVGEALPIVGEMAIGGPPVLGAAKAALPSAARAGSNFEKVMGAAKDIPVDVEPLGKVALRIMDLAERGGSMPKAVRDVLKRITDPNKAPMTYQEARDFAGNIGRLSVDEMNRLTPVVKRQVAELAAQLNKANADAAKLAGRGAEYKSAMREYARAMKMKDMIDTTLKHSKRAALAAAGLGGAAYWFGRD